MDETSLIPAEIADIEYLPRDPQSYAPAIGLIGCGSITGDHLSAYREAGYNVVALCDINQAQAKKRQQEFFPDANVFTDYDDLLADDTIEVVDIATHTHIRPPMVEATIKAGKHVLSQKPFVLDLDVGQRLVDLAEKYQVKIAVNQNGRWAPHFSYIRQAVLDGVLGDLFAAHCSVHWDHTWVKGTQFEKIHDLILYDYAIHWFDFVCSIFPDRQPNRVFSTLAHARNQTVVPPLLGQSLIEFDDAQASLAFDAFVRHGQQDRTYVAGSAGSINSIGPENSQQTLTIATKAGAYQPNLQGKWFPDGFHGTMGELLCSIEENRESSINARDNLKSLELCFAGVASSHRGQPVKVGSVRQLEAH